MIGRQVIITNRAFTMEELYQFMEEHWDQEAHNPFMLGTPTGMSLQKYILLPATERYLTIVYPVKAGGLFSRDNKVVLSTADTPAGMNESFLRLAPTKSVLFGTVKMGSLMSSEKERKGPAEEALLAYTAYMKELLGKEGYLK